MPVHVVSKRRGSVQPRPGDVVIYIGRPSVFGNPFEMRCEAERATVIEQYRDWLRGQFKQRTAVRTAIEALAARVRNGESLALQCWCAPCACHGDVIKQAIEGINARRRAAL